MSAAFPDERADTVLARINQLATERQQLLAQRARRRLTEDEVQRVRAIDAAIHAGWAERRRARARVSPASPPQDPDAPDRPDTVPAPAGGPYASRRVGWASHYTHAVCVYQALEDLICGECERVIRPGEVFTRGFARRQHAVGPLCQRCRPVAPL